NSIVTDESIARIAAAIRAHNSDAWYELDVLAFLPGGFSCPDCGGSVFRKEVDTLSVWFDSGSSCRAVLGQREGLQYPADVYMEGYDQLRAWFNESLMIGMATCGVPPYREVVTHGFTVDEQGRKMSKSVGNVVDPMKLMQNYGADILRWMAMSFDYFEDMRIGEGLLKQYADQYRDIRNRFRFMLGNLFDFDPECHTVPTEQLGELDRWILHRLQHLVARSAAAYDNYQYHVATRELYLFLSSDLSAFYLDVVKERLYTLLPDDPLRRSSQTALYELTRSLAIILSPILVHTSEEVWSHLPDAREQICSVHLAEFPNARTSLIDEDLARRWEPLFEVRREAQRSLDALRRDGTLKQSREASLRVR
ncbi:MAG: class I tRNA ligase family protein, partial [Chloroflexi bacterium]|nr:class I tRNA ligase family protein [Chloroflexota bacterium]